MLDDPCHLSYAADGSLGVLGSAVTAVSLSVVGWARESAMIRRASSACSSRTRTTAPPTPERTSGASRQMMVDSMPALSSRPETTMASDSCVVAKTSTRFSLGSPWFSFSMVTSRNLCATYDSAQSFPGIRRKVIFFEMGIKEREQNLAGRCLPHPALLLSQNFL